MRSSGTQDRQQRRHHRQHHPRRRPLKPAPGRLSLFRILPKCHERHGHPPSSSAQQPDRQRPPGRQSNQPPRCGKEHDCPFYQRGHPVHKHSRRLLSPSLGTPGGGQRGRKSRVNGLVCVVARWIFCRRQMRTDPFKQLGHHEKEAIGRCVDGWNDGWPSCDGSGTNAAQYSGSAGAPQSPATARARSAHAGLCRSQGTPRRHCSATQCGW